jgi:excisionase family DNA binding protein
VTARRTRTPARTRRMSTPSTPTASPSPCWLTAKEAAARAQIGIKIIRRAIQRGELKAARVGLRRDARLRAEWIDQWLESLTEPQPIVFDAARRRGAA